ncbi:unannotated protein [freshwater metagenome]|uniref:Unannotated protein n=1 Tax=freshwater metagenome TaxID=449393 RepID=A0A6J7C0U5_9ZZZZ
MSKLLRSTDETLSGARCNVEKVGSYQSTCPTPNLSNFPAVVETSLTAPFTRARSAIASESIISSSAPMDCIIACALSRTLRIGDSRAEGSSLNRPWSEVSNFTLWPYSSIASSKASAALVNASDSFPGKCLRAIAAARETRGPVNSSVTACVVRSINSCASSKITASRSGKIGCESTISIASKV